MARMVFGNWATGSRTDLPRCGRKAKHGRGRDGRTLCGRPSQHLHVLSQPVAPNGLVTIDCQPCLREWERAHRADDCARCGESLAGSAVAELARGARVHADTCRHEGDLLA